MVFKFYYPPIFMLKNMARQIAVVHNDHVF